MDGYAMCNYLLLLYFVDYTTYTRTHVNIINTSNLFSSSLLLSFSYILCFLSVLVFVLKDGLQRIDLVQSLPTHALTAAIATAIAVVSGHELLCVGVVVEHRAALGGGEGVSLSRPDEVQLPIVGGVQLLV